MLKTLFPLLQPPVPPYIPSLLRSSQAIATSDQSDILTRFNTKLISLWNDEKSLGTISSKSPSRIVVLECILEVSLQGNEKITREWAKNWIAVVQNVFASNDPPPDILSLSVNLFERICVLSRLIPDWSRENLSAQIVQKLVVLLVKHADTPSPTLNQSTVFRSIPHLVSFFPNGLRPVSTQIQNLAINAFPNSPDSLRVLASLYILAPKGKDQGTGRAWSKTVDGVLGSIARSVQDILHVAKPGTDTKSSALFTLAPLPLSQLPPATIQLSPHLDRVEGLIHLLGIMLTEGTINVDCIEVPIGHIVTMAVSLLKWKGEMQAGYSYVADSFVTGACNVFSRVGTSLGRHLGGYIEHILEVIEETILKYPSLSPIRGMMYTTYSIVLSNCPIYDPEFGSKGYARVIQLLVEEVIVSNTDETETKSDSKILTLDSRKNSITDAMHRNCEVVLDSLERLLRHPISHFLPVPLLSHLLRTLILSSLSSKTNISLSLGVYRCLLTIVQAGCEEWVGTKSGLLDKLMHTFDLAERHLNPQISTLGRNGVNLCLTIIHPRLPPFIPTHHILQREETGLQSPFYTHTSGEDQTAAIGHSEVVTTQFSAMEIDVVARPSSIPPAEEHCTVLTLPKTTANPEVVPPMKIQTTTGGSSPTLSTSIQAPVQTINLNDPLPSSYVSRPDLTQEGPNIAAKVVDEDLDETFSEPDSPIPIIIVD